MKALEEMVLEISVDAGVNVGGDEQIDQDSMSIQDAAKYLSIPQPITQSFNGQLLS